MNDEKQIARVLLEAKKLHEISYTSMDQPSGKYKFLMEECLMIAYEKHGVSTLRLWALLTLADAIIEKIKGE